MLGLLVGEGPGREEVEIGRPFVGATGRQLDRTLAEHGLPRHQLGVVNATLCQPPIAKTETMMLNAVHCCHKAFLWQLRNVPREIHIFAMGKWAAYQLTMKKLAIDSSRGFLRPFILPKIKVVKK